MIDFGLTPPMWDLALGLVRFNIRRQGNNDVLSTTNLVESERET